MSTADEDDDVHPFADEWIRDLGYFSTFYCSECGELVDPGEECCDGADVIEETGDEGYARAMALAEPYTGPLIPEDPGLRRAGMMRPSVWRPNDAYRRLRQVVIRYEGEPLPLPVWHLDMKPWDTVDRPRRRWHRCWSQTVTAQPYGALSEHEHHCPCGGRSRDGREWTWRNTRPAPEGTR